jgi:transposase
MQITTIGMNLAKNVFQVHAVDGDGRERIRRQLRRSDVVRFFEKLPACLVGMEACAGARHWARQIVACQQTTGDDLSAPQRRHILIKAASRRRALGKDRQGRRSIQ